MCRAAMGVYLMFNSARQLVHQPSLVVSEVVLLVFIAIQTRLVGAVSRAHPWLRPTCLATALREHPHAMLMVPHARSSNAFSAIRVLGVILILNTMPTTARHVKQERLLGKEPAGAHHAPEARVLLRTPASNAQQANSAVK